VNPFRDPGKEKRGPRCLGPRWVVALADGVAQEKGPDHDGEQCLPKAKVGIGQGKQPADEPDGADDVGLNFDRLGLVCHSALLYWTRFCGHDIMVAGVVPDEGLTGG
jgi:hypothetical protein